MTGTTADESRRTDETLRDTFVLLPTPNCSPVHSLAAEHKKDDVMTHMAGNSTIFYKTRETQMYAVSQNSGRTWSQRARLCCAVEGAEHVLNKLLISGVFS